MAAINITRVGQKITRQALTAAESSFPVTISFTCNRVLLEIIPDVPIRYATAAGTVVTDGMPIVGPSAVLDIYVSSGDTFYLAAQAGSGNVDFVVVDATK